MTSLNQTDQPAKSRRQGTVNQRHKGSWEIKYYGAADLNGDQKRISETVRGTNRLMMRRRMGDVMIRTASTEVRRSTLPEDLLYQIFCYI